MKIYKIIVIVLSVLIGIASMVWLTLASPLIIPSYTGSITSENYQILKDYAFETTTNADVEPPNEDIVISKNLTEESLTIDVDTSVYGIQAIFPISNLEEKIENGVIKYDVVIDYNNVIYKEHTQIMPPWFYIIITIGYGLLFAVGTYILLYHSVKEFTDLKKKLRQ